VSNFLKGIDDDKLEAAEREMLRLSGVPVEQFTVRDVPIGDEPGQYVHTIQVGHVSTVRASDHNRKRVM
jgi:hypothetical protein